MLISHSFAYAISRGIPGLAAFVGVAIYSRLLNSEDYGTYSLIIAAVGLFNVICFQWLRLVTARFLASEESQVYFLSDVQSLFTVISVFLLALITPVLLLAQFNSFLQIIALTAPLLIVTGLFELTLVVSSARFDLIRYGIILGIKAIISLGVGTVLAATGFGASAPVAGTVFGQALALLLYSRKYWRGCHPKVPDREDFCRYCNYGMPLIASSVLAWIISSSDRFMLAILLDNASVGLYSAGFDLGFQAITVCLSVINTAAFPLAIRAFEQSTKDVLTSQLRENGELIGAVGAFFCTCLIFFSPLILILAVGPDFRASAEVVMPIAALSALVSSLKSYHFDIAFHLGKRSVLLVINAAVAAVLNIGLNFLLIPQIGICGAAYSSLFSYSVALILSALQGRHLIDMPPMLPLIRKWLFISTATMAGFAFPTLIIDDPQLHEPISFMLGSLFAVVGALFLNMANCRIVVSRVVRRTVLKS